MKNIKGRAIFLAQFAGDHEPFNSLVSGVTGKAQLIAIASSSKRYLKKRGYLYLEHSPSQFEELKLFLEELNFINIS